MTPAYPVKLIEAEEYLTTYPRGYDRVPLAKQHVHRAVSHLETLRAWLDTNEPEAIFYEGEVWTERAYAWPWPWREVRAHVPPTFDVFQMSVEYDPRTTPEVRMHRRVNERSVGCYLMTRGYVEKLMRLYRVGQKYNLAQVYPRACAEEVLYDAGVVFTMPLVRNKQILDKRDTPETHETHDTLNERDTHETPDTLNKRDTHETHDTKDTLDTLKTVRDERKHDVIDMFWAHIAEVNDPYDLF